MKIELAAPDDVRIYRVAHRLKMDRFAVLGRCLCFWRLIYRRMTDLILVAEAEAATGHVPGFVHALVLEGLAEAVDDRTIRVRGAAEVIEQILGESARNSARGRRSAASRGGKSSVSESDLSTGYPQGELSFTPHIPTGCGSNVDTIHCENITERSNNNDFLDKTHLSTGYPQSGSHNICNGANSGPDRVITGTWDHLTESYIGQPPVQRPVGFGNSNMYERHSVSCDPLLSPTACSTAGSTDQRKKEDPRSEDSGRSPPISTSQNALRQFANANSVPSGTGRVEDDSRANQVANRASQESSGKPRKPHPAEALNLSSLLVTLITENHPTGRVTKQAAANPEKVVRDWADPISKLHRIDAMSWSDIEEMIRWAQKHQFWSAVILSGANLREKWDQMAMQRRRDAQSSNGHAVNGHRRPQRSGPTAQARREVEELEELERAAEEDRRKGTA